MTDSTYPSSLTSTTRNDSFADTRSLDTGMHRPPLTDRMAQSAHHTIDRLAETAAPRIERLQESWASAGTQLKGQARHAREKGDEWADDLRGVVRRNPLTSVAAALALGTLIVRLTR